MDDIKNIIVIGASAGGFRAINQLIANIPDQLPTAIFVVMHMGKQSMPEIILQHLEKSTGFTCVLPSHGDAIRKGHLYIAPKDCHMLLENRWRPSIDVLFRSAAAAYDSHTIGIVLSGMMDDGTSGMSAIKRSGGVCIVQEPDEAEFSDMPINVLNNVDVDYRVPVNDIGYILDDLFAKPQGPMHEIPEDIRIEAAITQNMSSNINDLGKIADKSVFICPECGGGLWAIKNDRAHRYRCHTGHTYNEKLLVETQAESIEASVWICIRMLEERKILLHTVAEHEEQDGNSAEAEQNAAKATDIQQHIDRLKALLVTMNKNGDIAMTDNV
jgi:two-component system chemotaxis response regulator CheB